MSFIRKGHTIRSDDTMDDDSDDKDSKRKSRNLSEKKRRDQFNLLVNELSGMVSSGARKMDKSTVLKSTIAFLKNHNEVTVRSQVNEIQEEWKPSFLTNEEFIHLVLEAVDGFIIVFSVSGQIFYTSESIMSLLGYLPNEVLNMTIYEMITEDEQHNLYNILLRPYKEETKVSFSCHMRRGGLNENQIALYEKVHLVGYLRTDVDTMSTEKYNCNESDSSLIFVGTGKLRTPQLILNMAFIDLTKTEFVSRHSLEWKFLFLDHRGPPIIGYLPFELLGTSGYDYYHVDDLEKVTKCHESLMQKGEGTSCYYRFLTKGQQWLWLQTRFYITYHQWNSKPEFIVCTHRVISYVDVAKQNRKDVSQVDVTDEPSTSVSWLAKPYRASSRHEAASDCTSLSADSPCSKQTSMQHHSPKPTSRHSKPIAHYTSQQQHSQIMQANQQVNHNDLQIHHQAFLEPPQYVAAIPMQPVISGFPSPTVLSPIPVSDTMALSPVHVQLQADLQRKHAELQTLIGQQQAELKRVSEQLIMARLGLFNAQTQQPNNVPLSYSNHSGTVSSTTNVLGSSMCTAAGSSVIVPVTTSLNLPQSHHSLVFHKSDANIQNESSL